MITSYFPGNNNSKTTVVYAAGKSGGHIVPCITLAQQEKNKNPLTKNIFFTTNAPLDKKIINDNKDIVDIHKEISLTNLPKKWYEYIPFFWNVCTSFYEALYLLYTTKPSRIISTGGIVALPVCLAGYILQIPIDLYELNATPGNAIVALASFADHINCCFEGLDRYLPPTKVAHADYPIRYSSSQIATKPEDARTALNLDPHKPTITILGGSQGSHFINTIMAKIISSDDNYWQGIQVIHQTGHNQVLAVQKMYTEHNIAAYVFDYSPNLSAMYAAADIIIGRAGAGSIFEAKAFKKRCILIPLETHSTDHQLLNAQSITDQYKQLFSFFKQGELIDNPLLLTHLIKSVLKRS